MGLAYESPTILDQANNLRLACIKQVEHVDGCAGCIFSKQYPNIAEFNGIKICYDGPPKYYCIIGYPKTWVLPKED